MDSTNTNEGLKRVIGVPGLAATVVNNTIGAGIYALPAVVGIEMGASGVHRSGDTVGVVVGVDIPPLRRHFGVGDDAIHQESPERVLIGRAREAAVDADHGDRRHGAARSAAR